MRDPNRIDKYCKILSDGWKKVPDWRFGQLLCNVVGEVMEELKVSDLFFPEDDTFFTAFEKVMEKYGQ